MSYNSGHFKPGWLKRVMDRATKEVEITRAVREMSDSDLNILHEFIKGKDNNRVWKGLNENHD